MSLENNQKPGKIYQAMIDLMSFVSPVAKDQTNREQGYKFRRIDDVYNAVQKAMVKAKVFNIAELLDRKDCERKTRSGSTLYVATCTYKFTFYAEDGSFVTSIISADGADSGDKAPNKAVSFAHKYALLTSLNIRTEDEEDPDLDRPEIDEDKKEEIKKPIANPITRCTQQQLKLVAVLLKELNITEDDARPKWELITGKKSRTEWTSDDARNVIDAMKKSLDSKKQNKTIETSTTWEDEINE